jgi:hypothetical protein
VLVEDVELGARVGNVRDEEGQERRLRPVLLVLGLELRERFDREP